ncbi:MAG: hypothetical protein RSD84_08505 [Bacteroidales bacterium]
MEPLLRVVLRKIYLLLLLIIFPLFSFAQTIITGKINSADMITVVVTPHAGKEIIGYSIADTLGRYRIVINNLKLKTLDLTVKGFTIIEQTKTIENHTQVVNFNVEENKLQLDEVIVSAKKISMNKDTVNYAVSTYLDTKDKAIRDVLKKMPGMQVYDDGQILYKGKFVKDLYIDGLDMMEGRYGIAVNNIDAKEIASVQIMEKHQNIKTLGEMEFSDTPAINLKLKESSKGVWSSNVLAALGGKPFARNIDANIMLFSKKIQNLSYFKSNNIGNDLMEELSTSIKTKSGNVGLLFPPPPNIDKSIYYLNNSNSATINQLHKLSKDAQISYGINFLNDKEIRNSTSFSNYYINSDSTLNIQELNSSQTKLNSLSAAINYKKNSDKIFIQDKASFKMNFYKGIGAINNDTSSINQDFDRKTFEANNSFTLIKNTGKGIYKISSELYLLSTPIVLNAGNTGNNDGFSESLRTINFRTKNNATLLSRTIPSFRFNLDFKFNLFYDKIKADLLDNKLQTNNTFSIFQYSILADPYVLFFKQGVQLMLSCPIGIEEYSYTSKGEDKISYNRPILSAAPQFSGQVKLNDHFDLDAMYTYKNKYLSLEDLPCSGYYTNYRTFINNTANIYIGKYYTHTLNASLAYKNIFNMMFGNVGATYMNIASDVMPNSVITNNLITQSYLSENSKSTIIQIDEAFSKGFYTWNAKISEKLSLGKENTTYLVNNKLLKNSNHYLIANIDANCSPTKWITLSTANEFTASQNHVNEEKSNNPLLLLCNNFTTNFQIGKRTIVGAEFKHYWNNTFDEGRNKFFLNLEVEYYFKQNIISLKCINLLDTSTYNTSNNIGVNKFSYIYQLRGITILLGFRIKLF